MSSWQPLYATLKAVKFNVLELQKHYKDSINAAPPKHYKDGDSGYDCLAITSRNGHVYDALSRQSLTESQKDLGSSTKAILPTEICNGYAKVLKDQLQELGFDCFRLRYMRLRNKDYIMPFHRDRVREEGAWRLHIPIFTNINCFFQWKSNSNEVHQVHLPADGRGHLVRVDIPHRALNNSEVGLLGDRVHFICDIHQPPNVDELSIHIMGYTEPSQKEKTNKNLLLVSHLHKKPLDSSRTLYTEVNPTSIDSAGSALINLTTNRYSSTDNYDYHFQGLGFSKIPLAVLALQKIKNRELDPNQSILVNDASSTIDELNSDPGRKVRISIMELINDIIHSQSAYSSLALAQYMFGDIDNYIANSIELYRKAGIPNPLCLQITTKDLKSNLISPREALKFIIYVFSECHEFFEQGVLSQYKFMDRSVKSSNRTFDTDSSRCIYKVKTKSMSHFNGVFLSRTSDGLPSEIRVDFRMS
jgi:hypothetical protein